MKRAKKFTALLLAALLMITAFAVVAIAEGEGTDLSTESGTTDTDTESSGDTGTESGTESGNESGTESGNESGDESGNESGNESGDESGNESSGDPEPDPNAYTVNVIVEGASSSAVTVYVGGNAISGTSYTGSDAPLTLQVEANAGYKVTAATFGVEGFAQSLIETDGKFNGSFSGLSAGYTYVLKVSAELIPVPATLSIEAVGTTGYTVTVDGSVVDIATAQIMTGSSVTVTFAVDGVFDASLAMLMHNGEAKTLTDASYSFVITSDTKLVLTYGNLVPITVTLNGPGTLEFMKTADSSPVKTVSNDTVGATTVTFYVTKDEPHKFSIAPALGYEVSSVEISEPRRAVDGGVYFFIPAGATTVNVSMKESQGGITVTNSTVQINVGMGGKVMAGGQTILGGLGTNVVVGSGESLTLTLVPDEGYVVDVVTVNGSAVVLTNNSYTISNIVAATTQVSVVFKSTAAAPDPGVGIGVADVNWSSSPVIVDVSGGKLVKREVFDHIATLAFGNGYVEFRSENGTIYYPYGRTVEGSAQTANMSVSTLNSGAVYESISAVLAGNTDPYRIYSFNIGLIMPEGTLVSFKLGSEFAGSSAEMKQFNSAENRLVSISTPVATQPDGQSGMFAYNDEGILVITETSGITVNATVIKGVGSITPEGETVVEKGASLTYVIKANEGFFIGRILVNDEEIELAEGLTETEYTFENVTESQTIKVEFVTEALETSEDEGNGGATTAIVIIIIVLVAVAGAAALFIVKWRQEKF